MVNSVGNNPNNYSGVGIYCNTVDVSKLSPEERNKFLEKMSTCTVSSPGQCYPAGYYMNNYAGNTVKKRVVVLTDEYVQSLDHMLDSENSELREYAASEVIKRLDEDKTRFNDKALNVLVNKMVLDPYDHKVRGRGLYALENQLASGNEDTIKVLEMIKQDPYILERDKGSVEKIMLQLSANTTLVNAPVTSGGTVVS